MTREEWLARCGTVYDMGLAQPEVLNLLQDWSDTVMRLEHTMVADPGVRLPILRAMVQARRQENAHDSQLPDVLRFRLREVRRMTQQRTCEGRIVTLASDHAAYSIIQLLAVLTHPCQACAEDRYAWHTRGIDCRHRRARA